MFCKRSSLQQVGSDREHTILILSSNPHPTDFSNDAFPFGTSQEIECEAAVGDENPLSLHCIVMDDSVILYVGGQVGFVGGI